MLQRAGRGLYPVMKSSWMVPLLAACVADPDLAEVSSEVSLLVLEAEDSTGAGTVVSDPTASGGAALLMSSPGTYAQQAFSTTGPASSGRVWVRTGNCAGRLVVEIDNLVVLGPTAVLSSGWTLITFNTPGIGAGNHVLELHHHSGCALTIDRIQLVIEDPLPPPPPPVVVEAEDATGAGTIVSDPAASNGAYRALSAAYDTASTSFTTSSGTTGRVRVRSSPCASPVSAKVSIDGVVKANASVPTSGAWVDLLLGSVGSGTHTIVFEYRFGPAGCALHYDHATFTP